MVDYQNSTHEENYNYGDAFSLIENENENDSHVIFPAYNSEENYYKRFWEVYIQNEVCIQRIAQLEAQNTELSKELNEERVSSSFKFRIL